MDQTTPSMQEENKIKKIRTMNSDKVQHVENQFIFEAGSNNTIIKDSTFNGPVYTYKLDEKENKKTSLTEEELKKKIEKVRIHIGTTKRLWFPVCKYMMWRKMVANGDFVTAVAKLESMFPGLKLDADDMSSLNTLSFSKGVNEWDAENAPVRGATFSKYLVIAELMYM